MLIKVKYQDGTIGEVEASELDDLISSRKIKKFRRSDKWVTIGRDPIRKVTEDYLRMPAREERPAKRKK